MTANQRWWIEVAFNSDADILVFEKCLEGASIRLVEFHGKFYIEDPRMLDTATMDEPFRYAREELPSLNVAVKVLCPEFVPVRFRCGVELFPGGYGQSIVATDAFIHGPQEHQAVLTFLKGPRTAFPEIMRLYATDRDLREALYYFGAEGNPWANLFKVMEIVEDHCGGREKLLDRQWCSRSSWERFKRTANNQEASGKFSRHARAKVVPPPDPMSLKEARTFAREVLNGFVLELLSGRAASAQGGTD